MRRSAARFCGAAAMLATVAWTSPSAAGEEATINAFAAWVGQGATFKTGATDLTFVGSLVGSLYIETDKGPVLSGEIVCPATVKIAEDASQRGTGSCTVTARDGGQVFADLTCTGIFLIGCEGDFKLTGGTQRFSGITGGGPVLIRSDHRSITVVANVGSNDRGTGILYLRGLRYTIP